MYDSELLRPSRHLPHCTDRSLEMPTVIYQDKKISSPGIHDHGLGCSKAAVLSIIIVNGWTCKLLTNAPKS
jgi:hypothetical protein